MLTMKDFPMGSKVTCLITGFHGTVVARTLFASGTVQYGVTPYSDDSSKYPDTMLIDPHLLEQTGLGISASVPQPDYDARPEFAIGALVREKDIALTGVVKARNWHINGCLTLDLVHPTQVSSLTQKPLEFSINANNAEVVVVNKGPEVKPARTGGPARRMQSPTR